LYIDHDRISQDGNAVDLTSIVEIEASLFSSSWLLSQRSDAMLIGGLAGGYK